MTTVPEEHWLTDSEVQQQLDVPWLVLEASERCEDHLSPTPLEFSMYLSGQIEGEVWLKLDSMQRTASFKFRGAVNKVVAVVCGRNIDLEVFKRIIQEGGSPR